MNDQLHDRLRQAADDTGQPLETDLDDLLGRARAGRSRHRTRIAGAALITAAALVGTSLGVRAALPGDDPAPAAGDRGSDPDQPLTADQPQSSDQGLAAREVIRRCLPQLAKYDDYPMYPDTRKLTAADWIVAHERDYAAGEIVALSSRAANGNPVLCAIPRKGEENTPVTFADLTPGVDQPALIAEVCSELLLPVPSFNQATGEFAEPSPAHTPDLRGATVAAVDNAGPVLQSLLVKDGESWACSLTPLTWDSGSTEIGRAATRGYGVPMSGSTTGGDNKSIVPESASYYTAAGVMPRDARSIEVTIDGGATFSVPVNDGNYAFVHKEPGSGGLVGADYRVLDASGNVVFQGSSM